MRVKREEDKRNESLAFQHEMQPEKQKKVVNYNGWHADAAGQAERIEKIEADGEERPDIGV